MIVSPAMSLNVWTNSADPYDHNSLAQNFLRLDQHDHSSGRGVQINTAGLANNAVTTAKIAPGAVTPTQLAQGLVTAKVYRAAALALNNSGYQSIACDTIVYDPGSHMSNVSGHYQFVCPSAGKYLTIGESRWTITGSPTSFAIAIAQNNSVVSEGDVNLNVVTGSFMTAAYAGSVVDIISCNANDTLDILVYSNVVSNSLYITNGAQNNRFSVQQVA